MTSGHSLDVGGVNAQLQWKLLTVTVWFKVFQTLAWARLSRRSSHFEVSHVKLVGFCIASVALRVIYLRPCLIYSGRIGFETAAPTEIYNLSTQEAHSISQGFVFSSCNGCRWLTSQVQLYLNSFNHSLARMAFLLGVVLNELLGIRCRKPDLPWGNTLCNQTDSPFYNENHVYTCMCLWEIFNILSKSINTTVFKLNLY